MKSLAAKLLLFFALLMIGFSSCYKVTILDSLGEPEVEVTPTPTPTPDPVVPIESVTISLDTEGLQLIDDETTTPAITIGGGSLTLYATIGHPDAADATLVWSVSEGSGVTGSAFANSSTGVLTAGSLDSGTAQALLTISVAVDIDGVTSSATGYVKVLRIATGVTILSTNLDSELPKSYTATLSAELLPAGESFADKTITWSIEEGGDSATIDPVTGELEILSTATAGNSVTVRATANNGGYLSTQGAVYGEYSFKVVDALVAITGFDTIMTSGDWCDSVDSEANIVVNYDERPTYTASLEATFDSDIYGGYSNKTLPVQANYLPKEEDGNPTNCVTVWTIENVEGASDTSIQQEQSNDSYGRVLLSIGKETGSFTLRATATSNGNFIGHAANNTVTGTITITITDIAVREVVVTKESEDTTGGNYTFKAQLIPRFATDQSVDWSAQYYTSADGYSDSFDVITNYYYYSTCVADGLNLSISGFTYDKSGSIRVQAAASNGDYDKVYSNEVAAEYTATVD